MRFGFVTCVQLGQACIEEILGLGGRLEVLFTLHDDLARKKSGRIYLDELAAQHSLPLTKIRNINDPDALGAIRRADLDWLFIIGWSQIARADVLSSTRRGVLGMHPTLLPEGRGRASIPWAIIKGLDRTGVTLFKLDEGVDTGPIAAQVEVPIGSDETSTTLYTKVSAAHRTLIRQAWTDLASDQIVLTPQDESRATEWPGRRPEDGLFDPSHMTVAEIDRLVRALTRPYPGAFIHSGDGSDLIVWSGYPTSDSPGRRGDTPTLAARDGLYAITEAETRVPSLIN